MVKNHSLLNAPAACHFSKTLRPPEQSLFQNEDSYSNELIFTFVPFIIFAVLITLFQFYYILCFVVLEYETAAKGETKLFNKIAFQMIFISAFLNCSFTIFAPPQCNLTV